MSELFKKAEQYYFNLISAGKYDTEIVDELEYFINLDPSSAQYKNTTDIDLLNLIERAKDELFNWDP